MPSADTAEPHAAPDHAAPDHAAPDHAVQDHAVQDHAVQDHAVHGAAKLVRMANQIAAFFETQPGSAQAAEVAGHLKAFWEPRMLRALRAHADAGGAGLSPLALEAVARLPPE